MNYDHEGNGLVGIVFIAIVLWLILSVTFCDAKADSLYITTDDVMKLEVKYVDGC